ncbi:hypothetical protein ACFGVR_17530 [Mucilaginibacter sp. AW1-3]
MKTQILAVSVCIILIVSLVGCWWDTSSNPTPSCTAQASSELTSINVFDGTIGSMYYGSAIANFKFSQVSQLYPNNCSVNTYGATSLKITNTISKTVSFSYRVTATIGIVSWQYQDAATVSPNSTIDVGVINSNVQRLNIGTTVIQLTNITYR